MTTHIVEEAMSEFESIYNEETTNWKNYVPPSDKSRSNDITATRTLSVASDLGKFIFCWSTVVLISPYNYATDL